MKNWISDCNCKSLFGKSDNGASHACEFLKTFNEIEMFWNMTWLVNEEKCKMPIGYGKCNCCD